MLACQLLTGTQRYDSRLGEHGPMIYFGLSTLLHLHYSAHKSKIKTFYHASQLNISHVLES